MTKKSSKEVQSAVAEIIDHEFMVNTSYKGNPMIAFNQGPEDEYPFSFGSSKAARLLAAMAEHGSKQVIQELIKLAGDKLSDTHREDLKGYIGR